MNNILHLNQPDWHDLYDGVNVSLPFGLWQIGQKPLLAHWLDQALEGKYAGVSIAASPSDLEAYSNWLREAVRWPLPVYCLDPGDDPLAIDLDRVPGEMALPFEPDSYWDLIQRHAGMERFLLRDHPPRSGIIHARIGRQCQIDSSVKIIPPVSIGNYTTIEQGCVVGPFARIGSGCTLSECTALRETSVDDRHMVGPNLRMEQRWVHNGVVIDRQNRTIDAHPGNKIQRTSQS